jgi:pectate lyase
MMTQQSRPWRQIIATAGFLTLLAACGGGGSGGGDSGSGSGSESDSGNGGSTDTPSTVLSVSPSVTGWASQDGGTTGGAGAPASNTYVVHNRAELLNALANTNSPTYATSQTGAAAEPKIIYVVGTIWGTDLGNGKFADEAYYKSLSSAAANWDWELYIQSQDTQYMADLNAKVAAGNTDAIAQRAKISKLSSAQATVKRFQRTQIQFSVPSNTTILGVGTDAKLIDGFLSINATTNIIVRNMEFQSPQDLTTTYDTTKQEWNATFKAVGVVTGKHLWFDHCTFSDGTHKDTDEIRTINGYTLEVMRHDGLLDMEDGTDYVTVSYSIFKNHDKTNMVGGSGDQNYAKERAYNHLTFNNNIWQDSVQRAPRVRFAKAHVYNNYYVGNTDNPDYPMSYYIGMGAESKILSEANVFDMSGSQAAVSRVISNLNGYQFKDVGSWVNSVPASADLEAAAKAALDARYTDAQAAATKSGFTLAPYTNELGWTPTYSYTRGSSADQVRQHDLANAGAGKLPITASTATRLQLDDTSAANYTVAKALAGSDAWTPQTVNSTQPNAGRINLTGVTPNYVVAQDGSGGYTTIQAALNAASNDISGAARLYIQVKAGTYKEQLIVAHATTPITLYSTESDASKVVVSTGLYQNSAAADYTTMNGASFATSVYSTSTNSTIKTDYNGCYRATAIGKQCATAIRIHNNGFNVVNMTFQNAWGNTDSKGNNQALAAMVDKADQVVFDGVRLISNQDTLYLNNSGKRTYFAAGEITGDVDFIFGAGTAVFDGTTIRYTGARKPSGGYNAAPSTPTAQTYGFLFNRCVFVGDSTATADGAFLARQWDVDASSVGKMIVRNSIIGTHIATTSGPWNATTVNNAATVFSAGGESYLAEYANMDMKTNNPNGSSSSSSGSSGGTTSSSSSSASSSSSTSSSSSSTSSSGGTPGTTTSITGASTLPTAYYSSGLPGTVGASYDSVNGIYSLVAAGSAGTNTVMYDNLLLGAKQVTGDFTLIARLTSLELPANLSTANVRAGLQIRNSLADNSRFYGVVLRGSSRVQWEQRLYDGGALATSTVTTSNVAAPVYLKLRRVGQAIYVTYSTDGGLTYQTEKSQDFSTASGATVFDSAVYVGIYGVSGSSTVTSTSTFDNVTLTQP